MLLPSLAAWLSFGSVALAGPLRAEPLSDDFPSFEQIVKRQDGACTNTARTRSCWSNGYSIATDFDAKSPPDGTVVTYNFEISNVTRANPDGSGTSKEMMLINGQYPGPLVRAKWGDTVIINVKNSLAHNGTGIHWHGIRQLNSCQDDGVPGITECPIAPGRTRQYKFRATQFGTTWYHSHFSAQYGDGVVGTMIIDGPATANYDVDLGTLPITDWYYVPAFTLNEVAQHSQRGPPSPDNILVNGTHINAANDNGQYARINVVKGKKYRIRLINTAVDSTFSVSMDGHPFTVLTSDFVPIKSYVTDQLTLQIGQRYDVVITANQTVDNYWFRVVTGSCGSNKIASAGKPVGAILHYDGASSTANPTFKSSVTMRTGCDDESSTNLIPFVPNTVPTSVMGEVQNHKMSVDSFADPAKNNLFRWLIDGTPHIVDWNNPSLETVLGGSRSIGPNGNVYTMDKEGWYMWYIQSTSKIALPHPIHLHGHDYYIVGRGAGTWDGSTNGLNFNNPTRRDTALLPAGGYMLIAFPADNPGMWIMHCHIAWHASQGLSLQFMERMSEIQGTLGDTSVLKQGCDEWDSYWAEGSAPDEDRPYNQTDSGI
ncbi:multicopper oxidase-domain-containing protein [Alternaria rosae]|uniref:multicopper oxidase-domain-containing protein n=1 Tax=Alternaria rosae TaxID=1187941 RepID=UPI001E8DE049|nr:multicopper oxidase-domain-containing protein [Alternaria rosae]KAH6860803.1 multicopper oxidase-domain-containing protein [Alternaria rosae]